MLRKSGVRPMKVWPAPGLLNRISALGKRGLAIILLSLALIAIMVGRGLRSAPPANTLSQPSPRHQIYGDPALMSELRATGYANVFENEGDRILAFYAQPGADVPTAATNHTALTLASTFAFSSDDPREVQELKSIVLGMKDELREYLANGVGTTETYLRRLQERQAEEAAIFERERDALKNIDDPAEYERVNAALRKIGLKTIPMPSSKSKSFQIPH